MRIARKQAHRCICISNSVSGFVWLLKHMRLYIKQISAILTPDRSIVRITVRKHLFSIIAVGAMSIDVFKIIISFFICIDFINLFNIYVIIITVISFIVFFLLNSFTTMWHFCRIKSIEKFDFLKNIHYLGFDAIYQFRTQTIWLIRIVVLHLVNFHCIWSFWSI